MHDNFQRFLLVSDLSDWHSLFLPQLLGNSRRAY
jgi:hypothetical protein